MREPREIATESGKKLGRLLAFGLSAASFGFLCVAFFYGREIIDMPQKHFQGGQGMALNAPIILCGMCGLPLCYSGTIFLLSSTGRKWKEVKRFPNPLTLVFLTPGALVSALLLKETFLR